MSYEAAYARGVQKAADMAAQRVAIKAKVPENRCGLATSILASPHLLEWPAPVREWIWQRCNPMFTRQALGLEP